MLAGLSVDRSAIVVSKECFVEETNVIVWINMA
jgi:hypothetical protein